MPEEPQAFTFPARMAPDVAQSLLSEAYGDLDEGRLLRRALKAQREADLDPPMDVQYVAQPRVQQYEDGLGIELNADILVYEDFDGAERCLDIFEATLADELMARLGKKLRAWVRANPP